MPEQTTSIDPISSLLAEFATRLNEVEEKQRLLRDRAILIGENLISLKEEQEKENHELTKKINDIDGKIKKMLQIQQQIMYDISNSARKTEVDILKRQWEMFQPLEFARLKEVKEMIKNK